MFEQNTNNEEKKFDKNKFLKDFLGMVLYVAAVLFFCFIIITYVGQRTQVSGSSMESTLSNGDNLIIDKISYKFHDPERFDIIVFPFYEYGDKNAESANGAEDTFYIKRIIGLPGETVWINEMGDIYINGVCLKENYGLENINYAGVASNPIILGPDEYFVMGDNRNNSTDSRFAVVGNIKREDIVGKAWMRIYPFDKFGIIKHQ